MASRTLTVLIEGNASRFPRRRRWRRLRRLLRLS